MTTVIVSEKPYPANEKFYNILTNHTITEKNYEHVLNACEAFKMNTLKDYHSLSLKVHGLLFFMCLKLIGNNSYTIQNQILLIVYLLLALV